MIGDRSFTKAVSYQQGYLLAESDNADAWNLIGYAHRTLGDYEQASVVKLSNTMNDCLSGTRYIFKNDVYRFSPDKLDRVCAMHGNELH